MTKKSIKDKPSRVLQDPSVPSRRSKRLAEALQNGSILWVPNVAHMAKQMDVEFA